MRSRTRIGMLLWLLCVNGLAFGETYFVNNKSGSDDNDGRSAEKPFATIARAVKEAKTSDAISLANTGVTYREPIPLINLGGTPERPFVVEGNGAVITGLREVKPDQWKRNGEVCELATEALYGYPYLTIDGERVPPGASVEKLAPGQWLWVTDPTDKKKSTIYFRPAQGKQVSDYRIEATRDVSGLLVQSSSYILVRNLVSEGHSNDGFNIHGDCRGIYCENIEARFNGDDGFSIHEAIEAVVRNGHFHHNGSGIEDVNLSRSFYSGIRVHDNSRLGVLFVGAFHSAVDAEVHDNPYNFKLESDVTKHLPGGEFSPIDDTSVYLQNVVAWGGGVGVRVAGKCRAMIANSIIGGSKIGITTEPNTRLHLTKSVVANCGEEELQLKGDGFFGDFNIYFPGRFVLGDKRFAPNQWEEFRQSVGQNEHSLIQDPKLSESHTLGEQSPKEIGRQSLGPTAWYFAR